MCQEKDDIEVEDNPSCPLCDGISIFLGVWGHSLWFRCENCGWQFKIQKEKELPCAAAKE